MNPFPPKRQRTKTMSEDIHKDLLHVYDTWMKPQLSKERLQELTDLGWIWYNTDREDPYWEVTHRGWAALEQAEMVAKPYE